MNTRIDSIVKTVLSEDFSKDEREALREQKLNNLISRGLKEEYLFFYLQYSKYNNVIFLDDNEVEFLNKYIEEYENSDDTYMPLNLYLTLNYDEDDIYNDLNEYLQTQYITYV